MPKIRVSHSKISGNGTFALQDFKKHDFVGYIKGPVKRKVNTSVNDSSDNPDWVGFKKNHWIDPLPPFKYINHSCDPNCGIKGTKMLYALRSIRAGEELTFDYSTSEIDTQWRLDHKCNCRSSICRKNIRSIQSLPSSIIKKYLPYIPTGFVSYAKIK